MRCRTNRVVPHWEHVHPVDLNPKPLSPNLPMLTSFVQIDGICTIGCTKEVAIEDGSGEFRVTWLYDAEGPSLSARQL